MHRPLPDLSRPQGLDFFRGFALCFRGLGVLFGTRRILLLTLGVAAVTLITLVLLFFGLMHYAPRFADALWTAPATWWGRALHAVMSVGIFLVLFVAGANLLPLTVAAPLIDPISIETERAFGYAVSDEGGLLRMLKEVVRALLNSLVRGAILIGGHLVLLLLLLVPVVGPPAWSVLGWLWTSSWLAVQYLDVPMARYLYGTGEEVAVLRSRFGLCLGFGAGLALLLWVPLLNFLLVPAAVVSGTMLFRALLSAGGIPPPPGARVVGRG